jgi:cyclopropane-fatty-acyl-phospholipid synthase
MKLLLTKEKAPEPIGGITTKQEAAIKELHRRILRKLTDPRLLRQVRFRLWDGSCWPDMEPRPATIVLNHPGSLRQMLSGVTELTLGEAYLRGDFDVEGDLEAAFELADILREQTLGWSKALMISHLLHQLPEVAPAPSPLRHRVAPSGRRHSVSRDREAIRFHYDLSDEFYSLWLDSRMVYSCACFQEKGDDLEHAKLSKLDSICRKLHLRPGQQLLDIGCGWGGLILHAAANFGVMATGITLSKNQEAHVKQEIERLDLGDRVQVRLQDYRRVTEVDHYDAIVSVGMVEHVGRPGLSDYFKIAHRALKPGGAFLNRGIGTGAVPLLNSSFINEYVFPDGEILSIGDMLGLAEAPGFEIQDVENLREHYALTLRHWVRRLEARHDEACQAVGESVYRIWRLYLAGCAHSFKSGFLALYQTLLTKLPSEGTWLFKT